MRLFNQDTRRQWMKNIKRITYFTRQTLGLYPIFFFPLMETLGPKRKKEYLVFPDTELVIEGFPRSGNTFALVAFQMVQNRQIKIAHHHHVPAQIKKAVKWNIPTLILIRKPDEAAVSLVIRENFLSLKWALKEYQRFYEAIMPYSWGYEIALFEEVINDYGQVIARLNRRFGTDFIPFDPTPQNIKTCFKLIEELDKQDTGKQVVTETSVPRPSEERKRLKDRLKKSLLEKENASALEKAFTTYHKFISIKERKKL